MQSGHLRLALLIATRQIDSETFRADAVDVDCPTFDPAAWAAWAKAALTQVSAGMATSIAAVTPGESADTGASVTAPTPARTTTDPLGRLPDGARF